MWGTNELHDVKYLESTNLPIKVSTLSSIIWKEGQQYIMYFESLRIKSPYKSKFLLFFSHTSFTKLLVDLKLFEKYSAPLWTYNSSVKSIS